MNMQNNPVLTHNVARRNVRTVEVRVMNSVT